MPGYPFPRLLVFLDFFLARLTAVEEVPPLLPTGRGEAEATGLYAFGFVRRPLRKAAATLFFADAVSMEKPFLASGAWSFRPANSQQTATLRRPLPRSPCRRCFRAKRGATVAADSLGLA